MPSVKELVTELQVAYPNIPQQAIQRQVELEQEMRYIGETRYENNRQIAVEKGRESTTKPGYKMLKHSIHPLAKAISRFMEQANSGKAGRRMLAADLMGGLEPETIAFITLRSVLDSVSVQSHLTATVIAIGGHLEDELRLRFFDSKQHGFVHTLLERTKLSKSYGYRRRVMNDSMNKSGFEWDDWPKASKVHVGMKCLELLMESTGLVEVVTVTRSANKSAYYVVPTPKTVEWLDTEHGRSALMSPFYLPCLIEPRPWTGFREGGYYTPFVRRLQLVKSWDKAHAQEMSGHDMPEVYQAVNTMQATAWRVNSQVLEVFRQAWEAGMCIGELPERVDFTSRQCPLAPGEEPSSVDDERYREFRTWCREVRDMYTLNARLKSKRIRVAKLLYVADRFAKEDRFYFPYTLDFRGRAYAAPLFLNPQGDDLAKSLLEFAEGKPVVDETAAQWLAVHGANTFGMDKLPFEDREAWTEEHTPEILASATDPMGNRFWCDGYINADGERVLPDKPWQFLAFCFEWKRFYDEGLGFVSRLPIALDGSCNGLQHFSALLKDPVGGAAVNLVPSDKPRDIYQTVADVLRGKLEQVEGEDKPLADAWLAFGISRKLTKRPVMILPYGGTRSAVAQYVQEHTQEVLGTLANREVFPVPVDAACQWLSTHLWVAMGEVVIAAKDAMGWLRAVSKLHSKADLPIRWTAPSGFRVTQAYPEMTSRRVKTFLCGKVIKPRIDEPGDTLDRNRQANGISPNFVHSLDAAALVRYVNRAAAEGIGNFALVHDSYGTLAADTERSAQLLREAFVSLYDQPVSPLQQLMEELYHTLPPDLFAKVPDLPATGGLDVRQVLDSPYFFA